jgi:hypothetical protein
MMEHCAAVRDRLVDQEAEGLRKLNLGRDQILARLWELATLSPETTRGVIAGQIKALSMQNCGTVGVSWTRRSWHFRKSPPRNPRESGSSVYPPNFCPRNFIP